MTLIERGTLRVTAAEMDVLRAWRDARDGDHDALLRLLTLLVDHTRDECESITQPTIPEGRQ